VIEVSHLPKNGARTAVRASRLFRETWTLALISVALAASIWFFVTEGEDPLQQETVPARITVEPVNVPSGFAVASVESVQVTVRAPETVLRRLSRDSFRATVDLRGTRVRESTAFVAVTAVAESGVDILRVDPAFVNVTLEPRIERSVPIRVRRQGSPRTGYEVSNVRVTPTEVLVSGPESVVELAEQATADAVFTGLQTSIRLSPSLYIESRQGGRLAGLAIEPSTASLEITVIPQVLTQTAVIAPSVKGSPAPGYVAASVQVEPAAVRVTGPIDAMQSLQPSISTADVDITDATGPQDLLRNVALRLPPGLRADQDQVIVRIRIVPARGEQVFQVAPQVNGLGSGLSATLTPGVVDVRLSGDVTTLQRLSPSAISVSVDIDGSQPGTYAAELRVQQPPGTQLVDWRPRVVTVVVTRR
jgi:YbbR domain-containing protein